VEVFEKQGSIKFKIYKTNPALIPIPKTY